VGVVELELESTSALRLGLGSTFMLVLHLFVATLAFALSGFPLWILYSLNASGKPSPAKLKQNYKLQIFTRFRIVPWYAAFIVTASSSSRTSPSPSA
jgi:hypothetical protein